MTCPTCGAIDHQPTMTATGTPYRIERGWCRADPGGTVHVESADDRSPLYRHWLDGRYDPKCSWCWLGYSHSERAHNVRVAA